MNAHSLTRIARFVVKLFVFGILLSLSPRLGAQVIQLSNTASDGGGVVSFQISDDGSLVVYTGALETTAVTEIFSASSGASGTQLKLNSAPVSGGQVDSFDFLLSPDGSRVVFTGDLLTVGTAELFSASTTSESTQILLSNAPVASGSVTSVDAFTPDGSRVIYRGDLNVVGNTEIFSASATTSGTQVQLNSSPSGFEGDVSSPELANAGTRVVYRGDLTADGVEEIYSALVNSSGSQITVSTASVFGSVAESTVSPDGTLVAYRADYDSSGVFELYVASTSASGTQIRVNDAISGGRDVNGGVEWTADSDRVVYRGDLNTDGVQELFSASATASGTQIQLSETPVTDGDVSNFLVSGDGVRAVFVGDLDENDVFEIFSASTTASGSQLQLNNNPVTGGDVDLNFRITSDSQEVVYFGDLITNGFEDLFIADIDAEGSQVQLTDFGGTVDILTFMLSPDDKWAALGGRDLTDGGQFRIYGVALDGSGSPFQITPDTIWSSNYGSFEWLPDSSGIVFTGDFSAEGISDLYSRAVPEPSTVSLLAVAGLLGLGANRRRRNRR